jgi:hypothetical protein
MELIVIAMKIDEMPWGKIYMSVDSARNCVSSRVDLCNRFNSHKT